MENENYKVLYVASAFNEESNLWKKSLTFVMKDVEKIVRGNLKTVFDFQFIFRLSRKIRLCFIHGRSCDFGI